MPGDLNFDNLNNPTWICYSTKSFTTIGRYGQYQAESFRYSLKEETQKLKLAVSAPAASVTSAKHLSTDEVAGTNSSLNFSNGVTSSAQNGGNLNVVSKRRKANGNADHDGNESSYLPLKTIKFGTNVDLSDERKFHAQLKVILNLYI